MRVTRSSMLRGVVSGVALIGGYSNGISFATDSGTVINYMVSTNDLEPLAQVAAAQRASVAVPQLGRIPLAIDSADRDLRSSVPPVNRSRWMVRDDGVFANSSLVLPLLIGDLEPPASPVSRPLVGGRLVGARPSLPINRAPLTRPLPQRSSR